jgi:hypothetical protein
VVSGELSYEFIHSPLNSPLTTHHSPLLVLPESIQAFYQFLVFINSARGQDQENRHDKYYRGCKIEASFHKLFYLTEKQHYVDYRKQDSGNSQLHLEFPVLEKKYDHQDPGSEKKGQDHQPDITHGSEACKKAGLICLDYIATVK